MIIEDDDMKLSSMDECTHSTNGESREDLTSLMDSTAGGGGGSDVFALPSERYERPDVRWLLTFPKVLEEKLQSFDDPIIQLCQSLQGKFWKTFSLAVTASVAIEIGIAVPYLLFFLGYDGIATELAYLGLILAIISQIPKRFVWRLRPYMAGRAKLIKKDKTSAFPSRAVTCGTVYSFALIWAYVYVQTLEDDEFVFRWWMPVFFILVVVLTSFARINLGVHYPSDCIAGLVQGVIVCLIGTALWRTDIFGCESCHAMHCYATNPAAEITMHSGFMRINWWLVVVVVAFILGVPLLSVVKPIDFWSKCDRVYAMLLPAIAFQLIMLCPHSTNKGYALPSPPPPQWYSFILAAILVVGATVIGGKFGGKRPMLMYALEFLALSIILFFWRLTGSDL
jgi:membrane-associated phospholipid phosphatase